MAEEVLKFKRPVYQLSGLPSVVHPDFPLPHQIWTKNDYVPDDLSSGIFPSLIGMEGKGQGEGYYGSEKPEAELKGVLEGTNKPFTLRWRRAGVNDEGLEYDLYVSGELVQQQRVVK